MHPKKITEENKSSFRVIADHLRASSFLIADGVLPSNEGRGYVLRRILRRGIRHAYSLGSKDALFHEIFKELKSLMGDFYQELNTGADAIKETLYSEEIKFRETLSKGLEILGLELPNIKNNKLDGKIAFKLYDTFGFPLDLTQDYLRSKNISVDVESFDAAMKLQKEEARSSWKGSGDGDTQKLWFDLAKKIKPTTFDGYKETTIIANISPLVLNSEQVQNLSDNNEQSAIITDKSCFYAESGGQVGDKGTITSDNTEFKVTDTRKTPQGIFIHFGNVTSGNFKIGQEVKLKIDTSLRDLIKKNHSATHLLHAALRNNLGTHVAQRGSLVNEDKLRFDFSHNKQISTEQIEIIQKEVTSIISNSCETQIDIKSQDEAIKQGAMALFGEKYGDEVRVVTLGENNNKPYSIELCGGTHVTNVQNIKKFHIISEESVSSGVRRIEACTGDRVDEFISNKLKESKLLEKKLDDKIKNLISQIKKLDGKISISEGNKNIFINKLENYLESLNNKSILSNNDNNKIDEININGINFVSQVIDNLPPKELRSIFDKFKSEKSKSILACITINEDKVSIVVGLTHDLIDLYDARTLIKSTFDILGSKGGGGRVDFAQAGGNKKDQVNQAFLSIKNQI